MKGLFCLIVDEYKALESLQTECETSDVSFGSMEDNIQQTHPLYDSDRDILDSLLGFRGDPGPDQLTSAARLATRYGDFPGADDIKTDLNKVVADWGLDRDKLNLKCREIWASGWRPEQPVRDGVGSGSDVSDAS